MGHRFRIKVYDNKPQSLCYGCKACEQICPRGAISMPADREGFWYPEINTDLCVDCGLCQKSCPTQDENLMKWLHPMPSTVDAAWNRCLEKRLKSTSGGLFFLIAESWIKRGGIVFGAEFDSELRVFHHGVGRVEELKNLRGSKYVQSDVRDSFAEAEKMLMRGENVMYSGTPCQIAGLKSFLGTDYDNLITVDLVCHGVPSPLFFAEYLQWCGDKFGSSVKKFLFRDKKRSGWRAYVSIILKNGLHKSFKVGEDLYSHHFHVGNISRRSCYSCQYSRGERVGDITLSDFWNSEKYYRELKKERKYGYNLVMCNTHKGRNLYEAIKSGVEFIECDTKVAVSGDVRLRHPEEAPDLREEIFELLNDREQGFDNRKVRQKQSFIRRLVPDFVINVVREIQAIR